MSEETSKVEYFQEAFSEFEGKLQLSVRVSQVKRYYRNS